MDLFEAIAKRHSYRGPFTDAPVPREDLQKIVQAGIQAPSGKNEQVASFVIVDDPELLRQIAALRGPAGVQHGQGDDRLRGRSAPVFEGSRSAARTALPRWRTCSWRSPPWATPPCGSMACCGSTTWPNASASCSACPAGQTVRVLLPIGVPAEPGVQKEKLPFEKRAWFNRYGGK